MKLLICCCLLASAAAARLPAGKEDETTIQEAGRTYQMGKFPYLLAGEAVDSKLECEDLCAHNPHCKYGTYVTKDADTRAGYNYQKKSKAGECWLSEFTHRTATACGVPCVGFRKVKKSQLQTSENANDDKENYLDVCTKDIKTCWDKEALSRISEKNCVRVGIDRRVCRANACKFGKIMRKKNIRWGCKDRPKCNCDPAKHPSHFNQCHRDPWSRHIVTTHLARKFHTQAFEEGAEHKCAMISADVCKCCTCMPTTVALAGYVDLGTEAHPVAADSNFQTFKDVQDYEGCMTICKRLDCTWGSFIARKQEHLNTCVIATSAPKADANGKLLTKACPTDEECHSFSASLNPAAVDMLNSRAFVKASDKPSDYKPSKEGQIHYEKCQWAEGSCSAVDRSGKPGLTGIHKTIPKASEKWCEARMAMGDYVEWSGSVCMYGCGVIRTEDTCEKAEDHFKMMNGANPCSDGEYWDDASETCASCSPLEYQPSSAHFLRACNKCPDLVNPKQCKKDCFGFNSACSNEKECGTLVSPELEAHCVKHPDDCTVDRLALQKCIAYCLDNCSSK